MGIVRSLLVWSILFASAPSALAVLTGRDLDPSRPGFEAYYDSVQDLTWLADANHARTSGRSQDGMLSFADALGWAASLSINGVTGWRLPMVRPINVTECIPMSGPSDCGMKPVLERSELAHLLANGLGLQSIFSDVHDNLLQYQAPGSNVDGYDVPGVDPGVLFRHVGESYWEGGVYRETLPCPTGAVCEISGPTFSQSEAMSGYWTPDGRTYYPCLEASLCLSTVGGGSSPPPPPPVGHFYALTELVWPWSLDPLTMEQRPAAELSSAFAWAVHPGDVVAVPEPERWLLLLSGIGLLLASRTRVRGGSS